MGTENLFKKDNKFRIATATFLMFGVLILALGAGLFYFQTTRAEDIKIVALEEDDSTEGEIVVHVDGAVKNPGVYRIKSGARVSDAIEAAGGLAENADLAKINLAGKVADGTKITMPIIGQTSYTQVNGQVAGETASGLININSASSLELDKLPGVGPATSAKIISGRPYGSAEELLSKKVVSSSVFGKIKDLVTAY